MFHKAANQGPPPSTDHRYLQATGERRQVHSAHDTASALMARKSPLHLPLQGPLLEGARQAQKSAGSERYAQPEPVEGEPLPTHRGPKQTTPVKDQHASTPQQQHAPATPIVAQDVHQPKFAGLLKPKVAADLFDKAQELARQMRVTKRRDTLSRKR